jgi:hypothetical protein
MLDPSFLQAAGSAAAPEAAGSRECGGFAARVPTGSTQVSVFKTALCHMNETPPVVLYPVANRRAAGCTQPGDPKLSLARLFSPLRLAHGG